VLQAVGLIQHFEDVLALLNIGDEMGGEEVGKIAGLAGGSNVVGGFGGNLVVEAGIFAEHVGKLVHEGGGFAASGHLFGKVIDLGEENVVLIDGFDFDAAQGLDLNLDGSVGLAANGFNLDESADGIEVVWGRVFLFGLFEGDDNETAVAFGRQIYRVNGAGTPNCEINYRAGKNYYVL
jgi:hypothetical protein